MCTRLSHYLSHTDVRRANTQSQTQTTRVRGSRVAASRTSVVFQHSFMCTCRRPCGVMYMCFEATQALISLITSFATSSIASALSLRNGRGKSSSETTALSPTRTSLPRGRGAMGICRRSLAMAVRGVQAALARLLRVDGHRNGLVGVLRRRRSGQLMHVPSCGARRTGHSTH